MCIFIPTTSVARSTVSAQQKTTPQQARSILASTPQIAYALVALMVKMNAIDVQVLQVRTFISQTPGHRVSRIIYRLGLAHFRTRRTFLMNFFCSQKTLTTYSANMPPPPAPPPPTQPSSQVPPASAVPPHFSQYRTPTPQTHTPPHYNGHGHTSQPPNQVPYVAQGQGQYAGPSGFGTPQEAAPQMNNVGLPDALASIPEEQKVMLIYIANTFSCDLRNGKSSLLDPGLI